MRVLLIEDDEEIADVVGRGLRSEGFEVDTAFDGNDGLWRALEGSYSAIVLDLLLPGRNGYEVCRQIREGGVSTPILVLTAKDGADDQIDLLDLGADGFLSKPVTTAVIVANLRALLRRNPMRTSPIHNCGDLVYDEEARHCALRGETVILTSREHEVLVALLRSPGYLSRDELKSAVWGFEFDGDPGIVDVYVRRLRSKIGQSAIENRRGLGFKVTASQDA